ncbi:hypothetical protein FSARC_13038 [Fusarium sarcochroum]|uniref:RING-type domain-containing protein n=1 Tax=Fusarium sarcochroum TaxID=1208366 RepID=A0A8H4T450_9HYPO|nr:hypothetical protein FSARC_13038 [Fusarium sarcochroum]
MSVTETYWPALKATFEEDPSAAQRLDLQCGICLEQMTLNDDDVPCEPDNEAGLHHGAYILPCGHIFGYKCASELMLHKRNPKAHHSCPTCRECLHSAMCECPHNKGTLLRVSEGLQDAMHASIEKHKDLVMFCRECAMEFLLRGLRRIAFLAIDFDDTLQGPFVLDFVIRTGEKIWERHNRVPDRRLSRQLEIPPKLLEIFEWLGRFVASQHDFEESADGSSESGFAMNIYEMSPEDDIVDELVLQKDQLREARERLVGMEDARYERAYHEAHGIFIVLGGKNILDSPFLELDPYSDWEEDEDGVMNSEDGDADDEAGLTGSEDEI